VHGARGLFPPGAADVARRGLLTIQERLDANNFPLWPQLFYLLRCGLQKEALEVAKRAAQSRHENQVKWTWLRRWRRRRRCRPGRDRSCARARSRCTT
jgi:hypothetical protein